MRRLLLAIPLLFVLAFLIFPRKQREAPSFPVTEEKPFTVVIPSFNNEAFVEQNLHSVFSQDYANYRVVYIDDASTDGTLEKALHLIQELGQENRTTLITNKTNQGSLSNLYQVIQNCPDHEIIVRLDGDDFLAHNKVLSTLNKAYANPNTWLTYGSSLTYPSYRPDPEWSLPLAEKKIRQGKLPPPPYTFYAALFKQIKLEDLFYRGHFYPMGVDMAIVYPLLEMAKGHIQPISDCLHLTNKDNPLACEQVHPNFHKQCLEVISHLPSYASLKTLPHYPVRETADLLILSEDNPLQLGALLESISRFATGVGNSTVLYEATSEEVLDGYLHLQEEFSRVSFVRRGAPPFDLNSLYRKFLSDASPSHSGYVALVKDTVVLTDKIDLIEGVALLNKTKAHGLFYTYHPELTYCADLQRYQPLPPFTLLKIGGENQVYAWQLQEGNDDWSTPATDRFVLFKKETLRAAEGSRKQVSLFYAMPKCIELSPTVKKYMKGLKLDISPLYHAVCPSQKIEADLPLIESVSDHLSSDTQSTLPAPSRAGN